MSKAFEGKSVVITGGNSGIGLATAKRFASEGAKVFITARREDELKKAALEIGHNAIAIPADISKLSDIKRLFETVKKSTDKIDVLFANAGFMDLVKIGGITEESYDKHFDVNVKGVVFTVQEALPLLKDGSAIILTSSIVSYKGFEGSTLYSATKAAVRSLARTWTSDLKSRRIRVNVVSPGPVTTPMSVGGMTLEGLNQLGKQVPIGRVGTTDEIANVVYFLASDAASFIAGADIQADGGFTQI
ncbi:DEKNAAC104371 [Brettanomyces naardenensis]|uniref:DEKNAAC104371 n=1 Tax=Brettanomyces naardenensis TaxID=13370 RepID=A0A448YQR4_BRENA|nr:DEKNAAC104371 [Brettanomyces naardenensis]